MSPRTYSGRECWVYRCHSPGELCGHHPDLITAGLNGSGPEYLLYSPLRETDRGPFQLEGQAGSHAVALTDCSLIVSRDPHRADAPLSVCRIPLSNIVTLSLGEALTLGWLVVRFVEGGEIEQEVVFFQSSGITYFRDVVRLWMGRLSGVGTRHGITGRKADVMSSPAYLSGQLDPLIGCLEGVDVFHAPESWDGSGAMRHCRCASSSLAVSSSVVLLAESERPVKPGMLVFGVNVVCIPRRVVKQVRLELPEASDSVIASLTIVTSIDDVGDRVRRDLALPQDSACRLLARLGSRAVEEGAA